MKNYFIYHIPNVKIGCSTEPEKRVNKQGYTEYEILETHTDIKLASVREQELQKEYGYPVDKINYIHSRNQFRKMAKENASLGGKTLYSLKKGVFGMSDKQKQEAEEKRIAIISEWKGEINPNSKLTKEKVLQIRNLYDNENYGLTQLSKLYNMGTSQISRIVKREQWKHI